MTHHTDNIDLPATEEEIQDPDRFLKAAKQAVVNYHNEHFIVTTHDRLLGDNDELIGVVDTDTNVLTMDDVFVVWFAKTLQNWKACVSTSDPDSHLYYEITYNGDRLEAYVDVYDKIDNQVITL